jgi:catechol 2,3-dioxygenase-like lactoylglutathione lyase family enzyme
MSATDPCGCPPTAGPPAPGRVHHVIVNANDLARSRGFYAALMPLLGYPGTTVWEGGAGFYGPAGSFWVKQAAPRFADDTFDKDRVGLCEVAFAAASREQVDAIHAALLGLGVRILDAPREYDYTPGYYAVFFADPDGLKLEVAHVPDAPGGGM